MPGRIMGAVMLALCISAGKGYAQKMPADSVKGEMRSALRALASAQEWYWTTHKTYTADLPALLKAPGCRVAPGVRVTIAHASDKGWAMESRHPSIPDQSCVYYMGKEGTIPEIFTLGKHLPGSPRSGRVLCDFDVPASR